MHERWKPDSQVTEQRKLSVARWTQLSLNVWTKDGFTALVQADRLVVIAPTGARRVKVYS